MPSPSLLLAVESSMVVPLSLRMPAPVVPVCGEAEVKFPSLVQCEMVQPKVTRIPPEKEAVPVLLFEAVQLVRVQPESAKIPNLAVLSEALQFVMVEPLLT